MADPSEARIAAAQLDALSAIHERRDAVGGPEDVDWCDECEVDWPCTTAALIAENARLRAAADVVQASEVAAWHAECDKVGIPHDPATLVRHHRANAALAATFDARTQAMRQASEVAQLRGLLRALVDAVGDNTTVDTFYRDALVVAHQNARAALAGSESPTNPDAPARVMMAVSPSGDEHPYIDGSCEQYGVEVQPLFATAVPVLPEAPKETP